MMARQPFLSVRLSPSPASNPGHFTHVFFGRAEVRGPSPCVVSQKPQKIQADAEFYQPQEPTAHGSQVSAYARCYRQQYHPALWRHIPGADWVPETASEV